MLRPEDCFHGNEVICIALPVLLANKPIAPGECPLKLGNIYVIEEYFPKGSFKLNPHLDAISLQEMFNGDLEGLYGWSTKLFRPIETKFKVFYDMLKAPLDPTLFGEQIDENEGELEEYLIQAL